MSVKAAKKEALLNLAVTRVAALEMAIASFIQSRGRSNATREWIAASSDAKKYELLIPFLAFAPRKLEEYLLEGFDVQFPEKIPGPPVLLIVPDGLSVN